MLHALRVSHIQQNRLWTWLEGKEEESEEEVEEEAQEDDGDEEDEEEGGPWCAPKVAAKKPWVYPGFVVWVLSGTLPPLCLWRLGAA